MTSAIPPLPPDRVSTRPHGCLIAFYGFLGVLVLVFVAMVGYIATTIRITSTDSDLPTPITMSDFNAITPGMPREDVWRIVGSAGEPQGTTRTENTTVETETWRTDGGGYLSVTYYNGSVDHTYQRGLPR